MATPYNYPTGLPCPNLAGNNHGAGDTFIRSKFYYAIRQRKQYCSQYGIGFTFIIGTRELMKAWKDFYYTDLNNGVKSFSADWEVEGIGGLKEFRFSSVYQPTALGSGRFQVSATFDLLTSIKDL